MPVIVVFKLEEYLKIVGSAIFFFSLKVRTLDSKLNIKLYCFKFIHLSVLLISLPQVRLQPPNIFLLLLGQKARPYIWFQL